MRGDRHAPSSELQRQIQPVPGRKWTPEVDKPGSGVFAGEIEDLLIEIQCLFPDSFVTFSETLPQFCEQSEDRNSAINFDILKVNAHIKDFCDAHGFGSFGPDVFFSAPDHYVKKLYAKDGLHLGRRGIDSLYRALGSFLAYSVMHDYCIG